MQGIKKALSVASSKRNPSVDNSVATSAIPETTSSAVLATRQAAFPSVPPKPLELKMPAFGDHFLKNQDRTWIINTVDTVIENMSTQGMKNLLRGKLPDAQISRIPFRDGSRNIAENIIGSLEPGGTLSPPLQHYHALGAFLNDLIMDTNNSIGYDAIKHIVVLLFSYTLLTERKHIEFLSAQFRVPSPLLIEEALMKHPYLLATRLDTVQPENVQERLESLYNRRRYLLDVKFLSEGTRAAQSVCRIDFDNRAEGTGFLVAPDLILTSYHVMLPTGYRGDPDARAKRRKSL